MKKKGAIAIITLDNPPVNALGQASIKELVSCMEAANQDSSIQGIILRGGQNKFIGGADITEFFFIYEC